MSEDGVKKEDQEFMERQAEFVEVLRAAGMSDRFYQAVIDYPGLRPRLVQWADRWLDRAEAPDQQAAREIMGKNFLGIPEVEQHFGELTKKQRRELSSMPFGYALRACAKTHILVADVGVSLLALERWVPDDVFGMAGVYLGQEFVDRTETPCWRLIRKTPVEGSCGKSWSEQVRLIDDRIDEIPSARQLVYGVILHYLVTGERLFASCYVGTCDITSFDRRIAVGDFGNGDLDMSCIDNDRQFIPMRGLASARKAV